MAQSNGWNVGMEQKRGDWAQGIMYFIYLFCSGPMPFVIGLLFLFFMGQPKYISFLLPFRLLIKVQ